MFGVRKYPSKLGGEKIFRHDDRRLWRQRFRARSEHAIATRRNFVKYDGKDSVEISHAEYLEVPNIQQKTAQVRRTRNCYQKSNISRT